MGTGISIVDYINSTVWCKLAPSKIHGVGVFAIRDIIKGTDLTDVTRLILVEPKVYRLAEPEFMLIEKPIRDLILDKSIFKEGEDFSFISPNAECYLQDFCNHSEEPNVDKWFETIRDIKEGEEILEDFREFTSNPHKLNVTNYNYTNN
jgi:SET domain-containing protein